jgi:hypothetical protein
LRSRPFFERILEWARRDLDKNSFESKTGNNLFACLANCLFLSKPSGSGSSLIVSHCIRCGNYKPNKRRKFLKAIDPKKRRRKSEEEEGEDYSSSSFYILSTIQL